MSKLNEQKIFLKIKPDAGSSKTCLVQTQGSSAPFYIFYFFWVEKCNVMSAPRISSKLRHCSALIISSVDVLIY